MPDLVTQPAPEVPVAPVPAAAVATIRTPDGSLATVPEADLPQALEAGAQVASPQEIRQADLQKEYGTAGGQLASAGLGAASGLTFGLGTAAAVGIGGKPVRDTINNYREANPNAYTAGEVGGMIAPMLIPGGAAGTAARIAKGAGSIPRAVGGLGRALATGTERALGEGLVGRVAGGALSTGAEMALMEAGSEVNEQSLGDAGINGEKLVAALGHGFLSGAEFGGALGAGGALLGKLTGKGAASIASRVSADALATGAEDAVARQMGLKMHEGKRLGKTFEERTSRIRELSRSAIDEGIAEGKTKIDMDALVEKKIDSYGKKIGDQLDALPASGGVDLRNVVQDFNSKYMDKLRKSAFMGEIVGTIDNELKSVYEKFGTKNAAGGFDLGTVSFKDANAIRASLGEKIAEAKGFDAPNQRLANKGLKELYGSFVQEFETAAERASSVQGQDFINKYQFNKKMFGNMKDIQEILSDEALREHFVNQQFGLKDLTAGGIATTVGAHIGGAVAGPVGAAAGAVVGGIGGGMANRFYRMRGNQIVANALENASKLQLVQQTTGQIQKHIEHTVSSFLGRGQDVATGAVQLSRQSDKRDEKPYTHKDYMRDRQTLIAMKENPALVNDRITKLFHPEIAKAIPTTVGASYAVGQRAAQYMFSKLPNPATPPSYMQVTSGRANRPVSDSELQKFGRYMQAVDRPMLIMEQLRKGRVSRDAVDAVRNVYPDVYQSLRSEMVKQISHGDVRLSKQQRTAMSIVFDVPVDATTEPKYIKETQAAYDPQYLEDAGVEGASPEATGPGADNTLPGAPKRKISIAGSFATAMDKISGTETS